MVRMQAEPILWEPLVRSLGSPGDGAVALFLGTVRGQNRGRRVLYLEYEAYAEMAECEMRRIEAQARERFPISAALLVHRTGRLEIGDVSVAVAVAAVHRAAAFEACRFLIESLKSTVPIWKKEFFEGGAVWIEGTGETPFPPQA
jgi:molybdopterin synthase catalytic subunit